MKKLLLLSLLLLAGCGKSELEQAYDARLTEAKAHCVQNGGDEFRPYGAAAWIALARLSKPASFQCQRLMADHKQPIAAYVIKPLNDKELKLEIRTEKLFQFPLGKLLGSFK